MKIHPTAIVEADDLPSDVVIGPWAYVQSGVRIGAGCLIAARATICSGAVLGNRVEVGIGAVVGEAPQDKKYRGEKTGLIVEDGVVIREYATLHRATSLENPTRVGERSLIMAYAHVAHDCQIGRDSVLSNGVQLAGHVLLGAGCNLGGLSAVHQFCVLGDGVFVAGLSKVDRDVPPFSKAIGNPARWGGFNRLGAERLGFSKEEVERREQALRLIYRKKISTEEALKELSSRSSLPEYHWFCAVRKSSLIQLPR